MIHGSWSKYVFLGAMGEPWTVSTAPSSNDVISFLELYASHESELSCRIETEIWNQIFAEEALDREDNCQELLPGYGADADDEHSVQFWIQEIILGREDLTNKAKKGRPTPGDGMH
jgi:hypothetical protein